MASGSNRERLKAFVRKPIPSQKDDQAVFSEATADLQTPSLTTRSSAVAVAGDQSSPSTGARQASVAKSSKQVPAVFEASSQANSPLVSISSVADSSPTPSLTVRPSDVVTPRTAMPESRSQVPALFEPPSQVPGILMSAGGGSFNNASDFTVNYPIMVDHPTNMTVNISSDQRSKAMKLLSKHTIHGAAHDSSARDPPPRCHPDTRVEINEHIVTWFYDEERQELLVWVYGSAGVGKSAIMQTLADKLAESKHLGASVFISRPNGRNASRQLFLTVGYQLAVQIDEYCAYITEKLARDPELVDKGMEEQFKIFVIEPFVERKIGAGAKPWGILLDGLDELDEHRTQAEIIRLVANFVLKHPDVPLLWAIASRPEPHIADVFNDGDVVRASWKRHVPTDPEDVWRFLRDNLENIQKKFPRTVPNEWPSKEQLRELSNAASGLFIFANTVVRFIEDPRYANPATRLDQVLSALHGHTPTVHHHPLASLDALYTSILSAIPPDVWPTTRRVLGTLLQPDRGHSWSIYTVYVLKSLGVISIILSLDINIIYASVNGCYSLLEVTDPKDAYTKAAGFYHASFSDYLLDPTRSRNFYISVRDAEDDLLKSTLNIWRNFKLKYCLIPGLTYENRWLKYFSTSGFDEHRCARDLRCKLMEYIHANLFYFLFGKHDPKGVPFSSKEDEDLCLDLLNDLSDIIMYSGSRGSVKITQVGTWLFHLWEVYGDELVSRGIIWAGRLEQVKCFEVETYQTYTIFVNSQGNEATYGCNVDNCHELLHYISHLKSCIPQLPVLAFGSPGHGRLLVRHQIGASDIPSDLIDLLGFKPHPPVFKHVSIPFSGPNSHPKAEHFLCTHFKAIQRRYSTVVPSIWPYKEQIFKLTCAVTHHFPFAPIALQFIQDSYSANPSAQLDQLLAVINEVDPSEGQPFIYVDALYNHILNSIPSNLWPTTQKILGVLLHGISLYSYHSFKSPKGISTLFGIDLDVVYAALHDCHLLVLIPPEYYSLEPMTFCHPSFCEYLMDPTRSQKFYVPKDSLQGVLYNILLDFNEYCSGISDPEKWDRYYDPDDDVSDHFKHDLLQNVHEALIFITQYGPAELKSTQIRDHVFKTLSRLDFFTMSGVKHNRHLFIAWLFAVWNIYGAELTSKGLFYEIELQQLQFKDSKRKGSYHTLSRRVDNQLEIGVQWQTYNTEYIFGLRLFQLHKPKLPVLIGGIPGGRFAVFEYEFTEDDVEVLVTRGSDVWMLKLGDRGYFVLPYSDEK